MATEVARRTRGDALAARADLLRRSRPLVIASAVALLLVLGVASLLIGSHTVPVRTALHALTQFDPGSADEVVVRRIRAPRTVVGLIVGLALGAAGAMMQALTKNPLAEPGLLGVNSGAGAAVAIAMAVLTLPGPATIVLAAMIGAAVTGALVLLLGGALAPRPDPIRLVLAGAALSTVLGAVSGALVLTYPNVFSDFRYWDAGAVVHRPWSLIGVGAVLLVIALVLSVLAARSVDALALGEDMGRALGASPLRAWALAGVSSVVLCGTATALAGPIAFVGLAAPHLARGLTRSASVPLLVSGLMGALLLVGADALSQALPLPVRIPVALTTGVLGGIYLLVMLRRLR